MKRIILLAFLMAVTLSACSQNPNVHKDSETQPQIGADQLRKDIGEMLLVGFRGTTITEQDPIVRDIRKYHVGSVILFEYDAPSGTRHRNISSPQQIKNLCADLQKYSSEPLLIGIDQEGGNVTRLRSRDGSWHQPQFRPLCRCQCQPPMPRYRQTGPQFLLQPRQSNSFRLHLD